MGDLHINEGNGTVTFKAKIVPGSSKTAIAGILSGMLKVKVASPAEKGKANQCLIDFLSKQLGVRKNCVTIISGKTNPVKTIQVSGTSTETVLEKLDL